MLEIRSLLLCRRDDRFDKLRLGNRSLDDRRFIHDGSGDGPDLVALGKVRELCDLHQVGRDQIALDGQLLGQPHRGRAVRSGGRRKDLQMDRLCNRSKGSPGLDLEVGSTPRHILDGSQKRGKPVSQRDAVEPNAVIL